jgi:Phage integrase, N-terminal SAM-like domain/Phage integrase family
MRQVIRRFLKHLDAEKNASVTTIESYKYDLHKFDVYLVKRLGNRFLPGDVTHDHIRDYLMWLSEVGYQKPNGPSARARTLAAIRSFFKYAHRAGLLRDNPAADIPLPKIRMGEVGALSHDECDRLLRIVALNPSPFRKVRDRAIIATFLLTGARLREIVHLDKGDIDLHQATIRLQRRRSEHSTIGRFRQDRTQGVFKAPETQEPNTGVVHILPQSKNFTWDCLVSSEEIFQEISNQDSQDGTTRFAPHLRDIAIRPGRESKSHSESYEPQESRDNSSVSAFSKPRVGKGGE